VKNPTNYLTPSETEVILQSRSTRTQNIETHYHLSPVSKLADNINPLKPTAPRAESFSSSDDTFGKINLERSGSENSLLHGAEAFDLGHVLLTPIDAAKRAETVYLDSALGAQAAPISFYPPINTTPTSELDYSALLASLPRDELSEVAASINSSTDLSDSDSDSNSDTADINPPNFSGTSSEDAEN